MWSGSKVAKRKYLRKKPKLTKIGECLDSGQVQENLEREPKPTLTSSLESGTGTRRRTLVKTQLVKSYSQDDNINKFETKRESVHYMASQELLAKEKMLEEIKSLQAKLSGCTSEGLYQSEREKKLKEDIAAMKRRYDEEIAKVDCEHQSQLRWLQELTQQTREEGEGREEEMELGGWEVEDKGGRQSSHLVRTPQASQGEQRVTETCVDVGEESQTNLGQVQHEYSLPLQQHQQQGNSDQDSVIVHTGHMHSEGVKGKEPLPGDLEMTNEHLEKESMDLDIIKQVHMIEVFDLQSKIKLKDTTIAYLEAELREEREKLERAKASPQGDCDCHRELKQSVDKLRQFAEQLRRDVADKADLTVSLKKEKREQKEAFVKQLEHLAQKLEDQNRRSTREVLEYHEQCECYREERDLMQKELNRVVELYGGQKVALKSEIASLSSELERYKKQVELLSEQLDSHQVEAGRLQMLLKFKSKEVIELERDLGVKHEEVIEYKQQVTTQQMTMAGSMENFQAYVTQQSQALEAAKEELKKLKKAKDALSPYILTSVEPVISEDSYSAKGAYGSVTLIQLNGGVKCAEKRVHSILLGPDSREIEKFRKECVFLSQMRHPNIVQFLGVREISENSLSLIMEFLPMSLDECITRCKEDNFTIPLPLKSSILQDVVYGLLHLHEQDIIHRDLSPRNILLTSSLRAKIADLGVSRVLTAEEL